MSISPEQFEKISKWSLKKIALFLFISLLLSGGGAWIFKNNKINSDNTYSKNDQKTNVITSINTAPAVLGDNDSIKNIKEVEKEFNEEDWEIDKRRIEKSKDEKGLFDGFLCAKDSKNFDSAIILYKEKIPLGITFKLRYTLKNSDNTIDNVPKLIFAFGDESNFRMFLPEDGENKFIGIEKINSDGTKLRNHNRLISKIDSSKENIFEITIKNSSANKASFLYDLKYFPLLENNEGIGIKQISDSDNFEEYLPWVDPGNVGFKQSVGIGVFNNVCIKITSATWSNNANVN